MVLSNASVVSLDEGVLTLRFPRQGDVKGFQTGRYEDTLKEVLYARFGVNVVVRAISGGDPPPGERRRPGPEPVPPPPAQPPAAQSPTPQPQAPQPQAAGSTAAGSTAAQPSRPDRAQPSSAPPAGALVSQGGTTRTFGDNVVSLPPDDEFDPDDEDMAAPTSAGLTGMALVQRELGAQIIGEFQD
jgi:DNA polymerase-3 subunit gamma/tau